MSAYAYRWLCLPPYFFLAWYLLAGFGPWRSPALRLTASLALGAGLAVFLPLVFGQLGLSFAPALWAGAALAGGLTLALHLATPDPFQRGTWHWKLRWRHLPFLLGFAAMGALIWRVSFRFAFHDQTKTQAHPALIESILRGNFPPDLQVFPGVPLKYHFGADQFAAALAYVTGLPGWQALDWLQVFGWTLAVWGAYLLCREFGLKALPSFLTAFWFLLAAGWTYLLQPWLRLSEWGITYPLIWPDAYAVFQRFLNPGVISWFFQTPYALGIPLFLACLAMIVQAMSRGGRLPWVLSGIALGTLAVVQVALFLTLLAATGATILLRGLLEKRGWKEIWIPGALVGGIALAMAFASGGFFETSSAYSKGLLPLVWPPGYLDHALHAGRRPIGGTEAFLWYLSSFGSLLFLAPAAWVGAALWLRRAFRPELAIFAVISVLCLLLPQFFYYRLSWDIIKWFCIFQIASVFLIVLVADAWTKGKTWYCLILLPFLLLDVTPSLRLLYGLSFHKASQYRGKYVGWFMARILPPPKDLAFLSEQFRRGAWDEVVLTTPDFGHLFSIYSGQAMAHADYNTIAFGVSPKLLQERNALIQELQRNFSVEKLRASPIRWIVMPCADFERTFSEPSKQAVERAILEGRLRALQAPGPACWKALRLEKF